MNPAVTSLLVQVDSVLSADGRRPARPPESSGFVTPAASSSLPAGIAARLGRTMPPAPPPFEYHEAPPPPDLAQVVHSFWAFRATNAAPERYEHTVWPDACVSIGVAQTPPSAPVFITVPARTESFTTLVRRGSRVCGIRFWPDTGTAALAALFGADSATRAHGDQPAPALVRAVTDLADIADVWSAMGAWAREFLPFRSPADAVVRRAIEVIVARGGDVGTRVVAEEVSLGPRQLQRRFLQTTGMTIKRYARVRRIRTVLALRMADEPLPWSQTAADAGFADQAHLAREFAALTGLGPRSAVAHLSNIRHRNVTP